MSFEEFISNLTKEDLELINREFARRENKIPTFAFSKIKDKDLKELIDIEKNFNDEIFNDWFENNIEISKDIENFLQELIKENREVISNYNEEDLKIKFLAPLLYKIQFKSIENKFRDFYEHTLDYKTDKFIFSGSVDFLVAKGLVDAQTPYFFIQEFKRAEEFSNPRPQLLAELISGVELNNWKFMKGAYIVGAIWNFVILEKLGIDKYQYFVSANFDSTKIEDLKAIYKNLLFVKNEIIEIVKSEK